jgi:hypothetical protein
VVLVAVSASTPSLACDLELSSTSVTWAGIGQGAGHLRARRVMVEVAGRRMPRPVERELLLPCPNGRLRRIDAQRIDDRQVDQHIDRQLELGRAV